MKLPAEHVDEDRRRSDRTGGEESQHPVGRDSEFAGDRGVHSSRRRLRPRFAGSPFWSSCSPRAEAGFYWWKHSQCAIPAGIGWGNGRLEADEIDIDTKFAGRIAEMLVDEGDMVKPARSSPAWIPRDLEASLKKAQAQVQQAQQRDRRSQRQRRAAADQQVLLAQQELDRTQRLLKNGYARPRKSSTSGGSSWTAQRRH